jgi:tRNA(fMet)-specific endonuclease VapC
VFVLDTDHLSILLQESGPEFEILQERLSQQRPEDIATTIITFQEQIEGSFAYLKKARNVEGVLSSYRRMFVILEYFCKSKVLPFNSDAQRRFDNSRRQSIRVGTTDLRIASICLATGSTLLSRNLRDFRKVPGLIVEDWTHEAPTE